jgi:hypothetical protein
MVINFRDEEFVEMVFEHAHLLKKKYQISNYGRIVSHPPDKEIFKLIKPSVIKGFNFFKFRVHIDGQLRTKALMVSKLVAESFIEKSDIFDTHLIHLDYNNSNDHFSNLKWVTAEERMNHLKVNPSVIAGHIKGRETKKKTDGHKLTISQVIRIKKALKNENRTFTLRELAKKYKVSDMQIHRIKTGENWKHLDELYNI